MINHFLKSLGLSQREVDIYLSLLPLGKASASVLAGRVGLDRTTTRDACNALVDKGFFRLKKQKNTFIFLPEPPTRIESLLEEKRKRLAATESKKNRALAELKALMDPDFLLPQVRYFEGRRGIIEIYEDILRTGKDVYCWTDLEKRYEILGADFLDDYIERRIRAGIRIHAIKPKTPEAIQDVKEARKRAIRLVEGLPIRDCGEIRVYGDNVAIITLEEEKPAGFVFHGALMAKLFKIVFQGYWEAVSENQVTGDPTPKSGTPSQPS